MEEERKKDYKQYLIIAPVRYRGELDRFVRANYYESSILRWIGDANQKNGLVFDDGEEIKEFQEEVSAFARELYQKKYKKEETK